MFSDLRLRLLRKLGVRLRIENRSQLVKPTSQYRLACNHRECSMTVRADELHKSLACDANMPPQWLHCTECHMESATYLEQVRDKEPSPENFSQFEQKSSI